MFTGIITDIGEIISISGHEDKKVSIATNYDTTSITLGASICCAGICLTVTDIKNNIFSVLISKATTCCTNSIKWNKGTKINLERALKFGDEVGGHLVSGHVDATGVISEFVQIGSMLALKGSNTKRAFILYRQ